MYADAKRKPGMDGTDAARWGRIRLDGLHEVNRDEVERLQDKIKEVGVASLSLDDTFPVSEDAWLRGGAKSGGSTMFLEPGKRVRVEDLLRGIIVQSGNDACIVAAEALASSEQAFAEEMTILGRELGLKNTVFKNSTGWPDPGHLTTARDLAILAQRTIQDFPKYYH